MSCRHGDPALRILCTPCRMRGPRRESPCGHPEGPASPCRLSPATGGGSQNTAPAPRVTKDAESVVGFDFRGGGVAEGTQHVEEVFKGHAVIPILRGGEDPADPVLEGVCLPGWGGSGQAPSGASPRGALPRTPGVPRAATRPWHTVQRCHPRQQGPRPSGTMGTKDPTVGTADMGWAIRCPSVGQSSTARTEHGHHGGPEG